MHRLSHSTSALCWIVSDQNLYDITHWILKYKIKYTNSSRSPDNTVHVMSHSCQWYINLSDFDRGVAAGARWPASSILETTELLGFSHTTECCKKKKKGEGININRAAAQWADRKANSTTLYSHDAKKSISACTKGPKSCDHFSRWVEYINWAFLFCLSFHNP